MLDKIEAPLGLMDRIFFLNATFDEGETYLIFATSMSGLFLMSVLLLYRKNEYTYWAQRLSLLVFLLSAVLITGHWNSHKEFGVIVSAEARSIRRPAKTMLFYLIFTKRRRIQSNGPDKASLDSNTTSWWQKGLVEISRRFGYPRRRFKKVGWRSSIDAPTYF